MWRCSGEKGQEVFLETMMLIGLQVCISHMKTEVAVTASTCSLWAKDVAFVKSQNPVSQNCFYLPSGEE
jgi:hypothetical protein